jgi:phosphoglucosamine mutase
MELFGSSGIRRIADRDLLHIGQEVGFALGKMQKDIIIGRDTRSSGNSLKFALLSGLLSSGVRCRDAGIVPTPTLAAALSEGQIGIMITASHNPPEYNGIKIFNADGSSFDKEQQDVLERLMHNPVTVPWSEMQIDCPPYDQAIENHIGRIVKDIGTIDKLKIVVDCGCGAAAVITPYLLQRLGCEVIAINSHPSGFFPHDIEPIEKNLGDLRRICREMKTVGIAHDGDADRMMAVDEEGNFISGDKMLVILARQLNAKSIVTTVDTSMVVEELGYHTIRTKVGDTYVSEMLRKGGDLGGEPSGAWIFPRISLCPDGIYGAALMAKMASKTNVASVVKNIPEYPMLRGSVPGDTNEFPKVFMALENLSPEKIDKSDGYKLQFKDGWLLCRPSGTEPKIRITTEAKSEARAHELYEKVVKIISNINQEKG